MALDVIYLDSTGESCTGTGPFECTGAISGLYAAFGADADGRGIPLRIEEAPDKWIVCLGRYTHSTREMEVIYVYKSSTGTSEQPEWTGGAKTVKCVVCAPMFNINTDFFLRLPDGAATGGTITVDGDYTVHTFTSGGTFNTNGNLLVDVEVLIVAGGAGGGSARGGGGGGGGVIGGDADPLLMTLNGEYEVVVGSGGAHDANGQDSTFNEETAVGGGFGGGEVGYGAINWGGTNGGSGGGGSAEYSGGTGVSGQGNSGASGTGAGNYLGGGGGGAGAAGSGVNGGAGRLSTITGTPTYYGPGGGGSGNGGTPGVGGTGGGGDGTITGGATGGAGAANSGGGGGGGAGTGSRGTGGAGGSGIVILRYLTL